MLVFLLYYYKKEKIKTSSVMLLYNQQHDSLKERTDAVNLKKKRIYAANREICHKEGKPA